MVEKALQLRDGKELRVVVGRGKYSAGKTPVLKPYIRSKMREMTVQEDILEQIRAAIHLRFPSFLGGDGGGDRYVNEDSNFQFLPYKHSCRQESHRIQMASQAIRNDNKVIYIPLHHAGILSNGSHRAICDIKCGVYYEWLIFIVKKLYFPSKEVYVCQSVVFVVGISRWLFLYSLSLLLNITVNFELQNLLTQHSFGFEALRAEGGGEAALGFKAVVPSLWFGRDIKTVQVFRLYEFSWPI
ncbi:hypothetical protein BU17DRAFT_69990 [Hysterangium stoloniferum]|nr:hypothetical protein BU17DRAFT_69990 [Hysterangium stoloniferum]